MGFVGACQIIVLSSGKIHFPDDKLWKSRFVIGRIYRHHGVTDEDGKVFYHDCTFAIREFPWHNLNIGEERNLFPFKPLTVCEV